MHQVAEIRAFDIFEDQVAVALLFADKVYPRDVLPKFIRLSRGILMIPEQLMGIGTY
jgi:hypothetical protein